MQKLPKPGFGCLFFVHFSWSPQLESYVATHVQFSVHSKNNVLKSEKVLKSNERKIKKKDRADKDIWMNCTILTQSKSSFLLNEKMGQWPIFAGASLLLPRLAFSSSSESLPLPPFLSRSPLLWAFELISAGIARCLIGHEAVCKERARASFFLFALSFNLLSSPPFPLSRPLIQCTRSLSARPLHSCTPHLLVVWMGMDWWRNASNWMRINPVVRGRESLTKQDMREKQLDLHKESKEERTSEQS